jgi:DNA-binding CsgD family transcriptional regulator
VEGTALLERDAAIHAIGVAVEAASRGAGQAVFLRADAGLGKSALLQVGRARADPDLAVVAAHGGSMEADLPFAYLEQLGLLGTSPSAGPRDRMRQLAAEVADGWTRDGPRLVLLDDLHWADRDSLAVLAFLARRIATLPVAVVAALRRWPGSASDDVDALAGVPGIRVLDLHELSQAATARLTAVHLGTEPAPEDAAWVWQVAGGNPVLIRHAAQALTKDRARPPLAAPERDRGRRHRALLLSHLAGLSADAVSCLRVCAVLGSRAPLSRVRALAELDPTRFAAEFDSLAASGIVQVDDAGTVRFSHDLVAAAVEADTPPALRQELHRRAFEHHAAGDDPAGATQHAVAAGLRGDERALRLAVEAATSALQGGAVASAARALDTAGALAGAAPPDWFLEQDADLRFAMGQHGDAVGGYRRLLHRDLDAGRRRRVTASLARALTFDGRLDDAVRVYERLTREAPADPIERGALAMEHAHAVWERTGPVAARAVLAAARGAIDPGPLASMVDQIGAFFDLQAGDPSGVAGLEAAALEARRRLDLEPLVDPPTLSVVSMHITALSLGHRFDEVLEWVAWTRARWWTAGGMRSVVPLLIGRLGVLFEQGRLAHVLTEADQLAREVELEGLDCALTDTFRAKALAARGDRDGAKRLVAATRSAPHSLSWVAKLHLDIAEALADLRWHPERASDAFRGIRAEVADRGLGHPAMAPWAALAIESHVAAGRPDDVHEVVEWLAAHARSGPAGWVRMVDLGARAALAAAAGSADDAEEAYAEAIAFPAANPLDRARIAYRYGCWLRRQRRPKEARPVLAEVVEVADRCGAASLLDLARGELRAAGGRRRRTGTGPHDRLTPQEHRVATLAATGASTREIAEAVHLAPSTVETHLTRIYRKLGVASKQELRRRGAALLDPEGG